MAICRAFFDSIEGFAFNFLLPTTCRGTQTALWFSENPYESNEIPEYEPQLQEINRFVGLSSNRPKDKKIEKSKKKSIFTFFASTVPFLKEILFNHQCVLWIE